MLRTFTFKLSCLWAGIVANRFNFGELKSWLRTCLRSKCACCFGFGPNSFKIELSLFRPAWPTVVLQFEQADWFCFWCHGPIQFAFLPAALFFLFIFELLVNRRASFLSSVWYFCWGFYFTVWVIRVRFELCLA